MKNKILTFIVSEGKLLALYSEPHQDHGDGGWFVVTGGVKENEIHELAVIREVFEETGLSTEEIMPLNWGSIYNWWDEECVEHNFITFVNPGEIVLNEEHSKHDWLEIDEFIDRIKWDDNKKFLKIVLTKALNKEKHFDKMTFKDYRENGK